MNKKRLNKIFQNSVREKVRRGFTIIETLVAIAILMIAITGPLVVSNKSLNAALYAKDQTTAAYIAQKEIEWIRNLKDNNIAGNEEWLTGISSGSCHIYVNANFICTYTTDVISAVNEARMTVTVTWKEGAVSNEVKLVANITNSTF